MISSPSDGQLLREFITTGAQGAFEELVGRHYRTALGAARAVLGRADVAEDIAQATFVVLAKKAKSLEDTTSLSGWLYRVAVCLARDERRMESRRMAREMAASDTFCGESEPQAISDAALAALHEELGDLSEPHRVPLVLHYIEGRSCKDAAVVLGCSVNSFTGRLTRAREKLHTRLTRRGITLGSAVLVAALGETASAAELPAGLVAATCAAAKGGAVSAKVAALTQSALKRLFWAKTRTVAAVCAGVVVVGAAGLGVALTVPDVLGKRSEPVQTAETMALSPEDAWIKELQARVEAAPWDALDLARATIHGGKEMWRGDLRGAPAGRRIWQTDAEAVTEIFFDAAGWKRGVLTGRAMILPEGELPAALAVPVNASVKSWRVTGLPAVGLDAHPALACTALKYRPATGRSEKLTLVGVLRPQVDRTGVWHRFALYFDTQVPLESVALVLACAWREDQAVPPAEDWDRVPKEDLTGSNDRPVSPSLLTTHGVSALWEGLKFVPLGDDMPAPPPGVGKETN